MAVSAAGTSSVGSLVAVGGASHIALLGLIVKLLTSTSSNFTTTLAG